MHLHKAYMYIDFQQNRVCRSVKTVHTNLFAQFRKLHKFATTNSNLKKNILDVHHHKTYVYINFQKIRLKHKSWPCLLDIKLPRKNDIDTDGRHDGQTDGRTDKRTWTNGHAQTDEQTDGRTDRHRE